MTVTTRNLPDLYPASGVLGVVCLFGLFTLLLPSDSLAAPKGPGGQTCKSSGTTTVNGKEEGTGRNMKCTADYCKYDECETSGPNIGKCYEKTSYSNVRDCKPAAQTQAPQNQFTPGQMAPLIQGQPQQPSRRMPRFQGGGIMRRGVDGEQHAENTPAPSDNTEQPGETSK